jgi:hypothetical protein
MVTSNHPRREVVLLAVEAKYTQPMQVVETQEMRDRVVAISEAEKISQAQVFRDMHEHAIAWREQLSQERTGGVGI